jgi:hypothetical protein
MLNNFITLIIYKKDYSNLVLRKTKSFNKPRYLRNRQYCITGVYCCLWLNIVLVFGLYYAFYRYTLKFGYVFIFYVVGILAGLLSFFSKNYFLGFKSSLTRLVESLIHDFLILFLEARLLAVILNK